MDNDIRFWSLSRVDAFDHYIAQQSFKQLQPGQFASQLWLENAVSIPHPLTTLLFDLFKQCFLGSGEGATDGRALTSDFFKRAIRIDKSLGVLYFSQPAELMARAFESVVQDHSIKNQFLVSGTKQTPEAKMGAYPSHTERAQIGHKAFRYFRTLGIGMTKKLQAQYK